MASEYKIGDAEKLDKEMSKKGPKEAIPAASGKSMDATAPEVKKKDAAQYKDVE